MPRLALASEGSVAASALARAFARDPVLRPLLAHRKDVVSALRRYFEIEIELALSGRGEVWLDDELLGVAVWHRPGAWPAAAHTPLRALGGYVRVFSRRFMRASRVATTLARAHPLEPHWYLPFVGVIPEAARSGIGSGLLEPTLARCDQDGIGAYLEATSEASARLFHRLGFEQTDALILPTHVEVRPMWREPRA